MDDDTIFPYSFSAKRHGGDDIRVDCFNEDGTGTGPTLNLTHATALELVRDLTAAIAANPYAR